MRSRTEILSSVFRQGETGYFHAGDIFVEAGELPRYVYQLRTGLAYQSCFFPDGRRAIVDVFAPGNVVGLEAILSLRARGTASATGAVKYLPVRAESFSRQLNCWYIAPSANRILVKARPRPEELAA